MPAEREKRSRAAIVAALDAIEAMGAGRPLRVALANALQRAPKLGGKERRHAAEAVRGVARWMRPIDAALAIAAAPKKPIPADRALLRYLAWRVVILGEERKAVAAALALPGPRRPRAVDDLVLGAVAEKLPRRDELPRPKDAVVALALRESVPDFLARRIVEAFGLEEAQACLAALNEGPRLALRVNAEKATREEALAALKAEGVAVSPGEGELALLVEDRAGLFDARAFRYGWVEVQDEGSQAVVEACAAKPGERWLDLCAGSGGKALALAAVGARVTAWDESAQRLGDLPRRARRAGARIDVPAHEPDGPFDGVLVDAPCSGSGAIHREPDARWRVTPEAVAKLARLQAEILERAAARVRPGGALVYATCSLLPEEGEQIARAFLDRHAGFGLEREERRWPQRQAGGGFYVARLRRTGV